MRFSGSGRRYEQVGASQLALVDKQPHGTLGQVMLVGIEVCCGQAPTSWLGVFAEFERAMIQERVKAGMARAKAEGRQVGRPKIAAIRYCQGA